MSTRPFGTPPTTPLRAPGGVEDVPVPDQVHPTTSPYGVAPDSSGYAQYVAPARTSPVVGWVAFGAGLVAILGSIINALVVSAAFPDDAFDPRSPTATTGIGIALLLASGLVVWFGFGLWAIIQGIVATVKKRGVWQGAVGIVLGLVGPWTGILIVILRVLSTMPSS